MLVVDDNQDVRLLWRTQLTLCGFDVTEACNGADAVEKALLLAPDLILMDFSMPGMNGTEAVRQLKRHAMTIGTPVIGLTAHGAGTETHGFRAICDTMLEKPVSPDDLMRAVRSVMRA